MVGEWARKTTSVDLPDEVELHGIAVYMERRPFRFDGKINTVAVRLK
jgi:hypothetical protein